MGWSKIEVSEHPLFAGIPQERFLYFVHSYRLGIGSDTIATCDYVEGFSAAVARKNFMGVQFHPEKSSAVGQKVLKNFVEMRI
jgi:glutamine amidotransferase